ncbi:MAG: CDP-diacylglycerol--serine O-phosphatidyltransferase [Zoogloeaceae bacterium]|jgi:CDP-diacylglycerol--serine O-phosphatidyltransferase|nr:CDP-diacylglycerol--serine O-phosphatidyltransferase [Zoogloeaceae bacterium]
MSLSHDAENHNDARPAAPLYVPAHRRRRGIYILPSLFTTGALFGGFFAIVQAMQGNFHNAAIAIFAAMILDGLDGRVARLVHAQSDFGAEYDSLADMVSFGVAPALVMYEWALTDMGRFGWAAAFIYCAGAALRLARFNTNIGVIDKRYFQGLASPAAAALVAGFVWVMMDFDIAGQRVRWIAAAITLFAGVSMVTNCLYTSFKGINLKRRVPFLIIALLALMIVLVFSFPAIPFALFCIYALSGYGVSLAHWLRRRKARP